MGDLISKEALVNEIVNTPTNSDGYNPVYLSGSATRQLEILDIISCLPTVSEQEIRNRVIEEFAEKFIYKAVCSGCSGCTNCYEEQRQCECDDWKSYMEIAEQKETEEPFFNFGSPVVDADKKVIRRFADWCYINGIDFSYMSTAKKSGKQFIDDVLERYNKEQMKEDEE